MSGPRFDETRRGVRFYDCDVPHIARSLERIGSWAPLFVRSLERIAEALERLAEQTEQRGGRR